MGGQINLVDSGQQTAWVDHHFHQDHHDHHHNDHHDHHDHHDQEGEQINLTDNSLQTGLG